MGQDAVKDMGNMSSYHREIMDNLAGIISGQLDWSVCKVSVERKYKWEESDTPVEPDISILCGRKSVEKNLTTSVPRIIIEVLSHATEEDDRTRKMELYARVGVEEYWLVHQDRRKVEIYRLDYRDKEGDLQEYHLANTVTEENKKELYFASLPHLKLDFERIYDIL
jgi:Uma2 family endonuclease